ncbi:MAG: homoserine dehydrogenase, partial [Catalinimonas sp.]
ANKKMVAEHLAELVDLQRAYGGSLLYEASSCGSIPIVRTLEEYYDNELLLAVNGIFNGSSNYILTKVCSEDSTYDAALREAQELGFAESDPTLDVGGYDSLYKLVILTAHAFGLFLRPEAIFRYGIQNLRESDIRYAREKGRKIKLVCTVRRLNGTALTLFVMPQLVGHDDLLYNVDREYNGVVVEAAFSEKQFFMGKGAGGHPTGSAVLSDVSATTYDYRYEYKKVAQNQNALHYTQTARAEVYFSYREAADLGELPIDMLEQYRGRDAHYLIGHVRLDDLYRHGAALEARGVFVALNRPDLQFIDDRPA